MNSYHRIALILGVVFTLVTLNSFALAQDQERRAVLRGLQGCAVIVEDLRPEIERDGLTRKQLQTDLELRFRMAGIKVLSRKEAFETAGAPYFSLCVNVLKIHIKGETPMGYSYNISVSLNERVLLVRNGTTVWGITWDDDYLVTTPDLSDIRQRVKDYVDIFINDYLAVNPK